MLQQSCLSLAALLACSIAGCANGNQPSSAGTGGSAGSGATGGTSSTGGAGGDTTGGAAGSGATGGSGGTGTTSSTGPCGAAECTGDLDWVRRYGPIPGQQFSYGLGVDGMGNATIAGGFNSKLDLKEKQLTTAGGIDMFWAKVDPSGVTVAARSFGGAGNDLATGVAADRKGNTAYYGIFSGTLDFGNGPLMAQNFRMFLARIDSGGKALWSKAFGDQIGASNQAAGIDANGNVIYAAGFVGDADFGFGFVGGSPASLTITKFTEAGTPVWEKQLATYMNSAVAVDSDGSILISGGGDMANPPDIGCGDPGAFRVFGRLDPMGACLWQKAISGGAVDSVAAEGGVTAVLGRCNGPVTIGADTLGAADGKRFVALFDAAGKLLGSLVVADDTVTLDTLAVDTHGGVVVKGLLGKGSADFAGHALTGNSFLVRLAADATWVWGKAFSGDASAPSFVGIAPLGQVYLFGRANGPIDFGSGVIDGGFIPDEDVVLAHFKP